VSSALLHGPRAGLPLAGDVSGAARAARAKLLALSLIDPAALDAASPFFALAASPRAKAVTLAEHPKEAP
jgi:hypothetical protein